MGIQISGFYPQSKHEFVIVDPSAAAVGGSFGLGIWVGNDLRIHKVEMINMLRDCWQAFREADAPKASGGTNFVTYQYDYLQPKSAIVGTLTGAVPAVTEATVLTFVAGNYAGLLSGSQNVQGLWIRMTELMLEHLKGS